MNVARLQELIGLALAQAGDLEMVDAGRRLRIELAGEATPAPAIGPFEPHAAAQLPAGTIAAPCFGIVHLTPAPGAAPFVRVGDVVARGQRLCLVEAMKVFNPVEAPDAGRVVEILVESGREVGRGQALLRLDAVEGG